MEWVLITRAQTAVEAVDGRKSCKRDLVKYVCNHRETTRPGSGIISSTWKQACSLILFLLAATPCSTSFACRIGECQNGFKVAVPNANKGFVHRCRVYARGGDEIIKFLLAKHYCLDMQNKHNLCVMNMGFSDFSCFAFLGTHMPATLALISS